MDNISIKPYQIEDKVKVIEPQTNTTQLIQNIQQDSADLNDNNDFESNLKIIAKSKKH